jgi:hypothetical protein
MISSEPVAGMPSPYAPPAVPAAPSRTGPLLRLFGAIDGGGALVFLGLLIANPMSLFSGQDPLSGFPTMGTIIILAGVSTMLYYPGMAMRSGAGARPPSRTWNSRLPSLGGNA